MISKKKYIVTIVVVVIITAFVTMTLGNVALIEFGNRIIVSEQNYNEIRNIAQKYSKQENVMNFVKKNFLYEANEDVMMEGAIKGMVSALGDPYTQFMNKKEFDALMVDTQGSFDGIGVYITPSDDNMIMVVSPIEDTPAEKAGLKTGDKIIRINGTDYTAEQMDEAVSIMKGMPNTEVTLSILRENDNGEKDIFDIKVLREKIKVKTIKSQMLENDVGYIRITNFDKNTSQDFNTAYTSLEKEGMKGIIVDLRYNPGGIIDATVEISDKFLGEGTITYTKTKSGETEYYNSDANKINIPLVLLINEGSASASEIMAGAVKDTQTGTLIGTKTFGKGIVQRVQPYGKDGEGIKITMSEYFTPNNINIHKIGIMPDIEIELPSDVLGYGPSYYDTDTQLKKGVEVLKEKFTQ